MVKAVRSVGLMWSRPLHSTTADGITSRNCAGSKHGPSTAITGCLDHNVVSVNLKSPQYKGLQPVGGYLEQSVQCEHVVHAKIYDDAHNAMLSLKALTSFVTKDGIYP